MITRIEVSSIVFDTRAAIRKKKLAELGFFQQIQDVWITDVYTINKIFSQKQLEKIASALANPVTQKFAMRFGQAGMMKRDSKKFTWAVEIGFLPGVTDNIAHTTREMIEDMVKTEFSGNEGVYTSQILFINGKISLKDAKLLAESLHNPLIQRAHLKSFSQFTKDSGMDVIIPRVNLRQKVAVTEVNLNVSDDELTTIGKAGIANPDGTRRGPLALNLLFMKTIQKYFKKLGRKPTDIELESIAQTWSEHCKHTIFNDPIDDITDGLFKTYIKKATEKIRKRKNNDDFCVSVFTDNSGAIAFDDEYVITHKVETHNSPSALDPFGGSVTGIVGVNRDTIGFGLGAKPIANYYGFCFANPKIDEPLYKGPDFGQKMLSSRRIMDGVIAGVNSGGNCSGIPTPQGFVYFDERFRGKPLVFVGTVGLIPRKIKNKSSHVKNAMPGDYIVMIGGRVGKDGIHGATFSSEALDTGSPATAVQLGDPITQKKFSDTLMREARDMLLYHSITDNGAGGLSCSIAEMAKESNGCFVELEKVPLKYPHLEPWEIWVSESQERMTLAVPKKNWKKFHDLMKRRGVEATVIGEFTHSGKCIVTYHGRTIMDLDLQFLHFGLPVRSMRSRISEVKFQKSNFKEPKDHNKTLLTMLGRLNIASFEFISQQYDHVVLGNSVLHPLQGRGRINGDTSVIRPVLTSQKGIIMSQGLYPSYSEMNPYDMAAASIDTAIRNIVAAGANPDYIALLDNFCWCSANEPERLYQLKQAAKACFDLATVYETPFVSGKDSMFNDFKGYDKNGNPITISIPPTLLITSFGVIDDVKKTVSLDAKMPGDLVYILGETFDEIGGSEYIMTSSKIQDKNLPFNENVPKVNARRNKKLYDAYFHCIQKDLIASAQSVGRGGLGVALSKTAMGGMLGVDINLRYLPGRVSRDDVALYSESQGRIVVTVAPENKNKFEKILQGNAYAEIGTITKSLLFTVRGLQGKIMIKTNVDRLLLSYRETFKNF